jgi:hypothetical protein
MFISPFKSDACKRICQAWSLLKQDVGHLDRLAVAIDRLIDATHLPSDMYIVRQTCLFRCVLDCLPIELHRGERLIQALPNEESRSGCTAKHHQQSIADQKNANNGHDNGAEPLTTRKSSKMGLQFNYVL